MTREAKIHDLVGQALTHVDYDPDEQQLLLTTRTGDKFLFRHNQDCCERVRIIDTQGRWYDLFGSELQSVAEEIRNASGEIDEDGSHMDSATETKYTFRTNNATVVCVWMGDSNGYYSEEVTITEVAKDFAIGARQTN